MSLSFLFRPTIYLYLSNNKRQDIHTGAHLGVPFSRGHKKLILVSRILNRLHSRTQVSLNWSRDPGTLVINPRGVYRDRGPSLISTPAHKHTNRARAQKVTESIYFCVCSKELRGERGQIWQERKRKQSKCVICLHNCLLPLMISPLLL